MTRDDIIRMAREADIDWHKHWGDDENRLERFAALVAADEREECAKESERMVMHSGGRQEAPAHNSVWEAAEAIRARGTPSLTCAKCGVNRMHEACKQPGPTCPLMGEAQ